MDENLYLFPNPVPLIITTQLNKQADKPFSLNLNELLLSTLILGTHYKALEDTETSSYFFLSICNVV